MPVPKQEAGDRKGSKAALKVGKSRPAVTKSGSSTSGALRRRHPTNTQENNKQELKPDTPDSDNNADGEDAYLRRGQGARRRAQKVEAIRRTKKAATEAAGLGQSSIRDPEEFPNQWALFQMLDTSQDGWIIGRELRNRLKKLGLAQHVSEILRMMDFDGDSRISFDEFVMGYETVWATKFGQRMLVSVVESAAEEGTMTQADVNAVMQRTWDSLLLAYQDAGGLKLQSLDESLPATTEGLSWVDRQEAAFRSLEGSWLGLARSIYRGASNATHRDVLNPKLQVLNPDLRVRLFLSSTFTDTVLERNYLMAMVWPEVRSFCQQRGASFEVVDMRWGIRDECSDDHQTLAICCSEITRCQQGTVGPSFLYIGSEKYGWRPPPPTMPVQYFEQLHLKCDAEGKALLVKWYKRNNNLEPPMYQLQRISQLIPTFLDGDAADRRAASDEWWATQQRLSECFRKAAEAYDKEDTWQQRSVTEMEVYQGMFAGANASTPGHAERSLVFLRRIDGDLKTIVKDKAGGRFVDMVDGALDTQARVLQKELRARVRTAVPASRLFEYRFQWVDGGITSDMHSEDVRMMCLKVREMVLTSIHQSLLGLPVLDPLTREVLRHTNVMTRLALQCHARDGLLRRLRHYLLCNDNDPAAVHTNDATERSKDTPKRDTSKTPHTPHTPITPFSPSRGADPRVPLVLYGALGVGKTVVAARAAAEAKKDLRDEGCVVVRFCGTTMDSSTLHTLLRSIVQQLATVYTPAGDVIDAKSSMGDVDSLTKEFHRWCEAATATTPLVLFIDGLDAMEGVGDDSRGRSQGLSWVPDRLPEHCRVVVTLNPSSELFDELRRRSWPDTNFVEVGNLADSKLDGILNRWLKEDQRALQAEQREALMASLADIDEGAPGASALLLRLAYRHCLHFASYDTELNLPQSINAYVQSLFERLEFHYGDVLVSRAFAYLACARHGLSEKEWLDLLSCDDEVMDAVLQYHRPPIRRLPSAVFTRMRLELDDYLVERSADGQPVFYWKYRLFHNVSALRYVGNVGKRRAICMHLADYFDGKKYESFPGREIDPQPLLFESSTEERKEKKVAEVAVVPNMRRLSELPNALLGAGDRQRLVDRLSDIRTFRLYVADEALVQELMQHWRDIEDLEDPVVAYSRALTQQLGDSKDARAILNTAELYNQVGRFFNKSARYEAAIDMCTQALSMREKVLGANHVDLAADVGLLATMRTSKGQFDEAMPLLIRACDILVLNYGEDDPRVGANLNNLGSLLQSRKEYDRALGSYEQALSIFQEACGGESAEVGVVLCNMGSLHSVCGRLEEAKALLSQGLPMLELKFGLEHARVASCLNNLATVDIQRKLPMVALHYISRDLMACERVLGSLHPDLAVTLNNLAVLSTRRGDHTKAVQNAKRAVSIYEEVYGSEHVHVAGALNTLGGAYAAQKKLESALPVYRRALAIQEQAHGEMHPKTLQARYNLAAVLKYGTGMQREALELIFPVMRMHEERCTQGDMEATLELAQDQDIVAGLCQTLGDFDSALEYKTKAVANWEAVLGSDHHLITTHLNQLGVLYEKLDRHDEALAAVRRRIELGASHGRLLPPPETMEDHLTEHFYEGFEMVMKVPHSHAAERF